MLKDLKIGNIALKNGVILAPMAGYTDRAMRLVCHEFGAPLTVTEMVSATAVCHRDKKTYAIARIREDEGPVVLQLFGSDPQILANAAKILEKGIHDGVAPVAIDINFGCPVNKIFTNGEGSALMSNPQKIYDIVNAVRKSVDLPVTAKMRAGISPLCENAPECAMAAESGGASMVTVHGRTKTQLYSGKSDRTIIKKVKESVKIPVIANGDIIDADGAFSVIDETGADGVMIGRGALGNPFIFKEIACRISGEKYTPPTLEERAETARRQLSIAVEDKGERCAVLESRGRIALYFRGYNGAAALRAGINNATSYVEILNIIDNCVRENQD